MPLMMMNYYRGFLKKLKDSPWSEAGRLKITGKHSYAPHGASTLLTAPTTWQGNQTSHCLVCFYWDMVPHVSCLECWGSLEELYSSSHSMWGSRLWSWPLISYYIFQIGWPQWENCLYLFLLCHLQVTILKVRAGFYPEERNYSLHRSVSPSQIQKSPIAVEEQITKLKN